MKKGFTLVELLAVIVILAIIAIIATPLITGVIEKSKKGAAESSAYGYVEAVDNYRVMALLDGKESLSNKTYTVEELEEYGVTVKGDKPTSGYVTIEDGKVSDYELQFGSYVVTYNETSKKAEATKTDIVYTAYAVGDEVVLAGGSEWYVVEDKGATSANVVLLSKYLVNATTNQQDSMIDGSEENGFVLFDDGSRATENNTYCLLSGEDYAGSIRYGCCNAYASVEGVFNNGTVGTYNDQGEYIETVFEGTVTEDSLIKKYVDSYVDSLNLGDDLISSGLISLEQLEAVGCEEVPVIEQSGKLKCENISWLKGLSYWTQTPSFLASSVYVVSEDGRVYGAGQIIGPDYFKSSYGLRPVITIHKDAIQS